MIKIKTSQLTERPAAAKALKAASKEAIPEEVKLVNIDFKVFEVHLENNDGIFIIDLDKTKNYKIKNGYLYKGLFKKIGKIKFIRIKRQGDQAMALTINTNIVNDIDGYLLDAKNVKGGYVVVSGRGTDTKESIPASTKVVGTLVYDAYEEKSYR